MVVTEVPLDSVTGQLKLDGRHSMVMPLLSSPLRPTAWPAPDDPVAPLSDTTLTTVMIRATNAGLPS